MRIEGKAVNSPTCHAAQATARFGATWPRATKKSSADRSGQALPCLIAF